MNAPRLLPFFLFAAVACAQVAPYNVEPVKPVDILGNQLKVEQIRAQRAETQLRQAELERQLQLNAQAAQTNQVDAAFPVPSVKSILTVEQFQSMGFGKLTQAELDQMDKWFAAFVNQYQRKLYARWIAPGAPAISQSTIIESSIDGDFVGWVGDTPFKLLNGQIWQQVNYAYTYHYAYSPKVTIYADGPGFQMKVDGLSETVSVKRVK